ncbi:neurogenic locus notch homolog protein 3-like [Halichondria panicea]|uniref:neurogenic locus notch homolog protein 3-like n=1 Tax=Halichondria panicea TaxID=6063 RepID=UPI00312BA76F
MWSLHYREEVVPSTDKPSVETTTKEEAVTTEVSGPCDELSCPSHATCETYTDPLGGSDAAFCLPSCELENGGCAEIEACSLEQNICFADGPCPPSVKCTDPCDEVSCPSNSTCQRLIFPKPITSSSFGFCLPSCELDNGGCAEDEVCSLVEQTVCFAVGPCPSTVQCSSATTEEPSTGVEVGSFPEDSLHSITGTIFILDTKTLLIKNFGYDGLGPSAFFYYYPPGQVIDKNGGGFFIPVPGGREDGGFKIGRSYFNEDFLVPLPEGVDACDIGTFTIWCEPFTVFFAVFSFPTERIFVQGTDECIIQSGLGTLVPFKCPNGRSVGSAKDCDFDNCAALDDQLQLSWTVRNDMQMIDFRLCGCLSSDPNLNQYMGFGLSGSTSRTHMIGADPVITWVDETTGPQAVDYFLTGYFQCRDGRGACPDEDHFSGSCSNDIVSVSGSRQGGQQCVIYTRHFSTNDSTCDIPIDPLNMEQYIVWGVGGLGETAFQHFKRASASDPPIHFGRAPVNMCPHEVQCRQCSEPFEAAVIEALEDTTFSVSIGSSGADRGYEAITGQVGWGIAYYINNTLVPELMVQRGQAYLFIVEAGNNPDNPANYHPFYITDDIHGSRVFKTPEEKMAETVFAGFDQSDNVTAAGRLCACREGAEAARVRESCGSRQEYEESQDCSCEEGEPAVLIWIPDENTPNIVYYQCAIHLNLGWRIRVQDAPVSDPCDELSCPSHATCETYTDPLGGSDAAFCLPSCELGNGGCAEDEVCSLQPNICLADGPCPPSVQCSPAGPCDELSCPSHATCERYTVPLGGSDAAFCLPSCVLENGGCAEGEVCSLQPNICFADGPCPPSVQCSPAGPCGELSCPSHATCETYTDPLGGSDAAFCLPSCELENGGCAEDEVCSLQPNICLADRPCPPSVRCSPAGPCDQLNCPSYTTCEMTPGVGPNSSISMFPFCLPSCELENGGCAENEVCSLVEQLCPSDGPCPTTVQCSPAGPCGEFNCPSYATCEMITRPGPNSSISMFPFCLPSCELENGGCAEDEVCSLVEEMCPSDGPCPPSVQCSPAGPCDQLNCPSYATCEMITRPGPNSSLSMFPFCLPSCELENGGCAENEACSLVEQLCPSDGPCPPNVQCSPAGLCDELSCPSHATCETYTDPLGGSDAAFCLPSCELGNGGCAEDEVCSLQPNICLADGPCPPSVQCSPAGPCDELSCPSHATCERYTDPLGGSDAAFCLPSCELENGGCAEGEVCSLQPNICFADGPCPPSVQCSPAGPCGELSCPSHATCETYTDPLGGSDAAFCLPSCELENGGCAEDEVCSLQPNICLADRPCPPSVRCSPAGPCDQLNCPSYTTCEMTPGIGPNSSISMFPFCLPSCELENGGCAENEVCSLVEQLCPSDGPCPTTVQCSPAGPCGEFNCPSYATCEMITRPGPNSSISMFPFCLPSCELENGGCAEDEVCSLVEEMCPSDGPCPPSVQCSPAGPCDQLNCPSYATCEMITRPGPNSSLSMFPFCLPSCELENGGCAENEACSLVEQLCPSDGPCPPNVQCSPAGLCDELSCPSHATCETYTDPLGGSDAAFCLPSCELENGGCAEGEVCSLQPNICFADGPCPPSVQCSPAGPCGELSCPSHATCETYTDPLGGSDAAFCLPSCELENGGCAEDEVCSLQPNICLADRPCPPSVRCSPAGPCDQLNCPSYTTCEMTPGIGPNSSISMFPFCLPSCELENGGCAENEVCSLVEQLCPSDGPCPTTVQCSPAGPCGEFNCPSYATCEMITRPGPNSSISMFPFCLPSCELENGGCAEDEVCSLVEEMCPSDGPCPPSVQCSPAGPCDQLNCPSYATCEMITRPGPNSSLSMFPFCLPSCELENGGCAENEACSLVEQLCPSDGPCPPNVQCSPAGLCDELSCPSHATCETYTDPLGGSDAAFCLPSCELGNGGCAEDEVCSLQPNICLADGPCPPSVQCSPAGPCDELSCPSHATCERYTVPLGGSDAAFCLPSCELENGGCAEGEVCSLQPNICFADGPCPPSVQCSPAGPCGELSCPSHATCETYTDPLGGSDAAFCLPSCELENGGCAEDEVCSLQPNICLADRPCPPSVRCSPAGPCDQLNCPSYTTCEMTPGIGPNSSISMFPFCLPSCELDNGGCAEDEVCSLVEQLCPSDGPCPTTVQCSPAGPCGEFNCPSYATCEMITRPGPNSSLSMFPFCLPSCELENGGCDEDEVCSLVEEMCPSDGPCPPSVQCSPADLCDQLNCPPYATCEMVGPNPFSLSGFAFCLPSCELENGGCAENEVCSLVEEICPSDGPCPPSVQCSPPDPCSSFRCQRGYRCQVYEPTNEAYCEPACDLFNGGCTTGTYCILRRDRACSEGPCPSLKSCCFFPRCDMHVCSARETRRSPCIIDAEDSQCDEEECPFTYCRNCYFSSQNQPLPGNCGTCSENSVNNKCTKRWATCTRRAHFATYGQPWPSQSLRKEEDFRCHIPPC